MSAIAHYLEEEGIATTLIALIRPHVEKSRPPRALWVPFQMGRPMGAPLNAGFQRKVLMAALELLDTGTGPVLLEDFPYDEPDSTNIESWRAPVELGDSIADEMSALAPFYESSKRLTGRTTVGVSGMTIELAAHFLLCVDTEQPIPNPRTDLTEVQVLRYAADDLKAYYLEAIVAAGRLASGWQLANWFWEDTLAGALIKQLRINSIDHPDPSRRYAAWWLVPDGWSDGETVRRMREIEY